MFAGLIFTTGMLLITGQSQAGILYTSSGIASPTNLVDFSTPSLASNTVVTGQYTAQGLTFAALGPGAVTANGCGVGAFDGESGFAGEYINTFGPGCVTNAVDDSFSMMFGTVVTQASFALRSYRGNGSNTFTVLNNGSVVDTFVHNAATDQPFSDFLIYGYLNITGFEFDEIQFSEASSASSGGYFIVDTVAWNAVPEPASLAIFGTICLVACGRRRNS